MSKLAPLGPPPKASSKTVTKVMKANRAKDTKPELLLRAALMRAGLTGYKVGWKGASGRPDIVYPKRGLAIFVHGCFWHRCPFCKQSLPKTNMEFWKLKFKRNKERDRRKRRELESEGWSVLELWECEIKDDLIGCIRKIKGRMRGKRHGKTKG
jgi:DNA mismatch endonuclease (patch repair protein)